MRSLETQRVHSLRRTAPRLLLLLTVTMIAVCLHAQNTNNATSHPASPAVQIEHGTPSIPTDANIAQGLRRLSADAQAQVIGTTPVAATFVGAGINNNGGFILDGPSCLPIHVYLIWYGNWTGNSALTIIPNFIAGLNGSSYLGIVTTYWGQDPRSGTGIGNVTNDVALGGQAFDSYSHGTSLDDGAIQAIVTSALANFGPDNFGVYFVLTSADVQLSDSSLGTFCQNFCGYHSDAFRNNIDIKYSFVGNPDRCASTGSCYFGSASPNGNRGADNITRVIGHELAEALTDPRYGNTWVDSSGQEVGDKCNNIVGTLQFSTGTFLVQALWENAGTGFCTFSLTAPPSPPPPPPPPPPPSPPTPPPDPGPPIPD